MYRRNSSNIWRNYFRDYKIHENAKRKSIFLSEKRKLPLNKFVVFSKWVLILLDFSYNFENIVSEKKFKSVTVHLVQSFEKFLSLIFNLVTKSNKKKLKKFTRIQKLNNFIQNKKYFS